jgi:glyceraldehyde-3-phosphate dehydrogenase type I
MACRIGINGFGRIGRMLMRRSLEVPDVEVVAINDLAPLEELAYLLKYDSVHGFLHEDVSNDEQAIRVADREARFFGEKEPSRIPWGDFDVDVVIEATGAFRGREAAAQHLGGGARKVLISAPSSDADVTVVLGVNWEDYQSDRHDVISMASCTTNSLAPVAKVLQQQFGIARLFITTVHAYTASQALMDTPARHRRRGRAGALSMVPTTTGAARATGIVLPELAGKMDGMAIRVPIPDGSVTDIVANLEKSTNAAEVNDRLREASRKPPLQGVLEVNDDEIVSADIVGNPHSAIVDGPSTNVQGNTMVKLLSWYDNEWGYSCRLVDVATRLVGS